MKNYLQEKLIAARKENRRLVAPLVGFPGLNMAGSTVKLSQQNYAEHLRVIKAVAERFEPDIIFPLMDLSVEANALGCYTIFPQSESATVLRDEFSLDRLKIRERINIAFDTRLLGYVETMKMMSISLPASIIRGAYITGPYSLAGLIMGADTAAMATVTRPDELHEVCRFTTEKVQEYTRLLIAAGAQAVCVLEPTAVMLGPEQFTEFSADYVRHIIQSCKYTGVGSVYHTCGNTMHLVSRMAASGVSAVSLDSEAAGVDLALAAQELPGGTVVMGNVNPTGAILTGSPAEVEAEVNSLLERMAPYPDFVLSTGCDLPQEVPLENVDAFMRAGRSYRYKPAL